MNSLFLKFSIFLSFCLIGSYVSHGQVHDYDGKGTIFSHGTNQNMVSIGSNTFQGSFGPNAGVLQIGDSQAGWLQLRNATNMIYMAVAPWGSAIGFGDNEWLGFNSGGWVMKLHSIVNGPTGGGVSIGVDDLPSGYKLAVAGNVLAEGVTVELQGNWPDYVFRRDYPLPTLTEVEQHIVDFGHLPGVPSEAEVQENGISLGEMNAILLQKVEELTLYTLQQQEAIEKLEKRLSELEK